MTVHKLRPKSVCVAEIVFSKTRRIGLFHILGTWAIYPAPGAKPEVFYNFNEAKVRFNEMAIAALERL